MSNSLRSNKVPSKKLSSHHTISMPILKKNLSEEKTKKQPPKRLLKKCKSKRGFQTKKDGNKRGNSQIKTHKKLPSIRVLKKSDSRKSSIFIETKEVDTAGSAYFPDGYPKSEKNISPQNPMSSHLRLHISIKKKDSDSSRTMSRDHSKHNLNTPNLSFRDVL